MHWLAKITNLVRKNPQAALDGSHMAEAAACGGFRVEVLPAEMQNAGLAGVLQITLVAGAGFEPATFGL